MSEPPVQGSAATQDRLARAAIDVIDRDGILAGLNLREVAELAGVNRGNIYHYFGSRRELLRSALTARFAEAVAWLGEARDQPLVERKLRVFRSGTPEVDTALLALLAIDGDTDVDPLPDLEHSIADLNHDVATGAIHRDHDVEALQIAFQSLARGYALFRNAYARRLGVRVEDLDERVATIVGTWLEAMRHAPPAA